MLSGLTVPEGRLTVSEHVLSVTQKKTTCLSELHKVLGGWVLQVSGAEREVPGAGSSDPRSSGIEARRGVFSPRMAAVYALGWRCAASIRPSADESAGAHAVSMKL